MPFPNLRHRRLEPEVMDNPSLEVHRHVRALKGLERLNRWSCSVGVVWPSIRTLAREAGLQRLRVLDIATGGGDVPIGLWRRARREGLRLEIDACDQSLSAVEYARKRRSHAGANIRFFQKDALSGAIPPGYDVIVSSLFLHHLNEEDSLLLLRRTAQAAKRMVLVNDLIRHPAGLVLATIGSRLLSRSDVVHADAPQSVRAAYTISEIRSLARRAGLDDATITWHWPYRFLLAWKQP